MAEFTYEAMSATSQRSTGTVTANSEREAMSLLDARGLYPLRIQRAGGSNGQRFTIGGGVRGRHMASFYSQLADLLHSGVPLLRSLDILDRMGTKPRLQAAIRDVRAKVADGTGLSQAMALHPAIFNELAVSMVRAGQEGGFLEDVLKRVADFTEQQEELKGKVLGALAYPIFLVFAGVAVLLFAFLVAIPQFKPMFAKLEEKGQLPLPTVILLAISAFLRGNWWWLLLLVIGGLAGYITWARTEAGRYRRDLLRLKIPGAGQVFLSLGLSRFTRILGTLLQNGIPILRSLDIAKDSTGNRILATAIQKSAENVTAGQKLAAPLGACRYFPRDVVEMIAVAEESNNLEKVLVQIADSLDRRTARQLDLFVRLLEPFMLLVMAVVIGGIVASLLMPVIMMGKAIR